MSNEWGSDVFVSVHCHAAANRQAHGTETFYFPLSAEGHNLASYIQGELIDALGRYDRGVKSGNLWVVRYTNCPAALVELAFISNPEEEALLADQDFQYRCAVAIWRGVKGYLGINTLPPQDTPLESNPTQYSEVVSREDWSDTGLRNKGAI